MSALGDSPLGSEALSSDSSYVVFGVSLNPIVLDGSGTINVNPFISDVLADQHNILLYAAELHAWSLTGVAGNVIYTATQEFGSLPTDTPANQPFSGTLDQALSVRRSILGSDIGVFTIGDGILEINNTDAGYDYLIGSYAIDGRNIVVKAGKLGDLYSTNFLTVFNGTASDWTISEDAVHLVLRDFSYKLTVPAQTNLYGGTGGRDGGTDLLNKKKPRAFGYLLNVSPPLVDSAQLIYQLNNGRIKSVSAVYDKGVALTADSTSGSPDAGTAKDAATYAALEALSVAAGKYVTCLAEGYIKLGSTPAGTVTCDFAGDALGGAFISTTGTILRRLITTSTTLVDPTDLYTQSFTDMELLQTDDIGYWMGTDNDETVAEIIAKLMRGVGGWGGFRRDGKFELRVFRTPAIIDSITSDPYTKLLLHCDGTEGSTTFTDELGHTVTAKGAAQITNVQKVFDGGAALLSPTGSPDAGAFLHVDSSPDWNFAADFTIDFWIQPISIISPLAQTILARAGNTFLAASDFPISPIQIRGSAGSLIFEIASTDSLTTSYDIMSASIPVANYGTGSPDLWFHIALVRAGNSYMVFINGTLQRTVTSSKHPYFCNDALTIGARYKRGVVQLDSGANNFNGRIDEFRISNGIARWISDFAVPTTQYTVRPSLSSTPVVRLDRTDIFSISREPLPSSLTPLPWRHRVVAQRNWTVQTSDLAGGITSDRRTFVAEPYRLAEASNTTIQTNHPFAKDLDPVESYFNQISAAQTEANRKLVIYTEDASLFRMTVPAYAVLRYNLGDIIHVTYPRWDLVDGRKLTIVEISEDARSNKFEIVAYG